MWGLEMMMRLVRAGALIAGVVLASASPALSDGLPPVQPLVDAAKEGEHLVLPPGTYAGPAYIEKAITLDGDGKVTIDSGGEGSVLVLDTDGAVVKNLRLINSGESHNDIDSGVQIRGKFNVVKDNVIENTLFGVDLQQSDSNIVRRNRIIGKDFHLGVRGDAIRLWYSRNNRIEDNEISRSRDMVVWYSADNVIRRNTISGGRYGLHFMYARYNLVEENVYRNNSVGIFLMYSDGVVVRGNRIAHGQGATGMGIGLKETSDVTIEDNEIVYCATGLYLDVSPFQPETTNRIRRNRIGLNGIGVLFHNDWTGNLLRDNRFESNYVQVSVNARASAARNDWSGNYWDDYAGFDRNQDGIGDSPYEKRVYADRLWMDVPYASFFRGSPVLSLLDFLERLAPFSEPIVLLQDDGPKMTAADVEAAPKRDTGTGDDGSEEAGGGRIDPFGLRERIGK